MATSQATHAALRFDQASLSPAPQWRLEKFRKGIEFAIQRAHFLTFLFGRHRRELLKRPQDGLRRHITDARPDPIFAPSNTGTRALSSRNGRCDWADSPRSPSDSHATGAQLRNTLAATIRSVFKRLSAASVARVIASGEKSCGISRRPRPRDSLWWTKS